ncbi:hypothetical protein BN946_scf184908.g14 [Trametes cinnabarina]|uniref:6-methylsalicylate decarboxylase n=1 Tax=Pycnoporus cinnabarinus TaxID=5643 RepID=A0A060S9U6_PYCCI|nr:hypothetical protein BN946_scf184908.g14 [Trametes cinnabarina]
MAEMGIGTAVLSLPAGLPAGPVGPQNREAARHFNEHAAEICREHPGKFGFFACLPNLKDTDGALAEIGHALDYLKAWGIAMSSSYGEAADAKYIGDDMFDSVWEELDRRAAVVFLHGNQIPSSTPYPHPFLGIPVTEVPNETFKAAAHLVVTGKKRRFPNVKIILAHLGGSTPFLAPRVAVLSRHMGCTLSHEEIVEDFKTFYYDLALGSHEITLTAMRAFVGEDRLLFGTDFPAVSIEMAGWYTRNADAFFSDDRDALQKVMYQNARSRARPRSCAKSREISPDGGTAEPEPGMLLRDTGAFWIRLTLLLKRRSGKIDVHHHNFPNMPWTPEKSIAAMDELGIEMAILSLPDGWPGAVAYNRKTAQICNEHPDRFGFSASLPDLRQTEAAAKQLIYALDELHANAVSMSSSYGDGPHASQPARVWEELDRRAAVVFLHGAQTPSYDAQPSPLLGVPVTEVSPYKNQRYVKPVFCDGAHEHKYPNVKIVLAHLGGNTIWLAPRAAVLWS